MAYKCTLLSSLVSIRYEATIDTLEDMEQSGLPLLILKSTTMHKLIASDPRENMKQAYKKGIFSNGVQRSPGECQGGLWQCRIGCSFSYFISNFSKLVFQVKKRHSSGGN